MQTVFKEQKEAQAWVTESNKLYYSGNLAEAIDALRKAVLLYSKWDATSGEEEEAHLLRHARARACKTCADYLMEAGRCPEAATLYQEAVDVYSRLPGELAEEAARRCAHKTVLAINALRVRPQERLMLLIESYDRERAQAALQSGSEAVQGHWLRKTGQVFQRRERYPEARARYEEALLLFLLAPTTLENRLLCADCHHQLGNLLLYRFQQKERAAEHFRNAIAIFDSVDDDEEIRAACTLCRLALQEAETFLSAPKTE